MPVYDVEVTFGSGNVNVAQVEAENEQEAIDQVAEKYADKINNDPYFIDSIKTI